MVQGVRGGRRLVGGVGEQDKGGRLGDLLGKRVVKDLLAISANSTSQPASRGSHQCKHATLPLDLVGAGGDLSGVALAVPVDVQQAGGVDLVDGIALAAAAARRLGAPLGVVVPDGWSGGRVI